MNYSELAINAFHFVVRGCFDFTPHGRGRTYIRKYRHKFKRTIRIKPTIAVRYLSEIAWLLPANCLTVKD